VTEDTRLGEPPPSASGADIRTFLFADMRGYTRFTQEHGDDAASALAGRFADLVREAVPEFEGELLELRGDEALCVFRSARQALRAAVAVQRRLRTPTDKEAAFPLGVGMGLDAGEAVVTQGGYRGKALNLAARLCSLAAPGQVLATEGVVHLAHRVEGVRFVGRRPTRVKGVEQPVRMVEVQPLEELPPLPLPSRGPPSRRRSVRWALLGVVVVVGIGAVAVVWLGGSRRSVAGSARPAGVFSISSQIGRPGAVLPVRPPLSLTVAEGGWADMAVGDGVLWMTSRRGLQEFTLNGKPVNRMSLTGGGGSVAVGLGDRVFVTSGGVDENKVYVIDPHNMANGPTKIISGQRFNLSQSRFGVATGYQSVWVWESGGPGCCQGRVFWRINPDRGRVIHRWLNPSAVAIGQGWVWLIRNGRVYRIDPHTNELSGPLTVPTVDSIATGAGAVWALYGPDSELYELNSMGRVAWSGPIPLPVLYSNLYVSNGAIWILSQYACRVVRVDAVTKTSTAIPIPSAACQSTGPIATTPNSNRVWIAYPGDSGRWLNRPG
jgi:adenylate cyclase